MNTSSYKIIEFKGDEIPVPLYNYVMAKWARSFRYGNDYFRLIRSNAYYESYHPYLENLLSDPESRVRLAVLSDDEDVILGFSTHRGKIFDYVYVHKDYRFHKIGTSLLPEHIETFTHLTKTGLILWGSKYPSWQFNPFA